MGSSIQGSTHSLSINKFERVKTAEVSDIGKKFKSIESEIKSVRQCRGSEANIGDDSRLAVNIIALKKRADTGLASIRKADHTIAKRLKSVFGFGAVAKAKKLALISKNLDDIRPHNSMANLGCATKNHFNFVQAGKKHHSPAADLQGAGRLVSDEMRKGMKSSKFANQLHEHAMGQIFSKERGVLLGGIRDRSKIHNYLVEIGGAAKAAGMKGGISEGRFVPDGLGVSVVGNKIFMSLLRAPVETSASSLNKLAPEIQRQAMEIIRDTLPKKKLESLDIFEKNIKEIGNKYKAMDKTRVRVMP